MSTAVIEWINGNWRTFHSPRKLYQALKKEARSQGWMIPGESWLYRRWRNMPEIVRETHQKGQSHYESKYAPYVPRDYGDLEALQVLCGDHSERDVSVLHRNSRLVRPWLTLWQDLRTGLLWGWHLDIIPSSVTSGLAYENGVLTFGAQPFSRPEANFYSYIYTDRARDYRAHNWDGKVISVHRQAMKGLRCKDYFQAQKFFENTSLRQRSQTAKRQTSPVLAHHFRLTF